MALKLAGRPLRGFYRTRRTAEQRNDLPVVRMELTPVMRIGERRLRPIRKQGIARRAGARCLAMPARQDEPVTQEFLAIPAPEHEVVMAIMFGEIAHER